MKAVQTSEGWAWQFTPDEQETVNKVAAACGIPEKEFWESRAEYWTPGIVEDIDTQPDAALANYEYPSRAAALAAGPGACAHFGHPWIMLGYRQDDGKGVVMDVTAKGEETPESARGEETPWRTPGKVEVAT